MGVRSQRYVILGVLDLKMLENHWFRRMICKTFIESDENTWTLAHIFHDFSKIADIQAHSAALGAALWACISACISAISNNAKRKMLSNWVIEHIFRMSVAKFWFWEMSTTSFHGGEWPRTVYWWWKGGSNIDMTGRQANIECVCGLQ